jgi:hypothetical protein
VRARQDPKWRWSEAKPASASHGWSRNWWRPCLLRRVIDAAAVLGSRFPFDVLAALVGVREDDLIPLLRRLVDAGLLVEDEADVVSFRHALTREAIAGQLLGRERRRLPWPTNSTAPRSGPVPWSTRAAPGVGDHLGLNPYL